MILALLKQAVKAVRDGLALLETMGEKPMNKGNAYIYLMNVSSKSHIFITYHYHVAIDDTFTM